MGDRCSIAFVNGDRKSVVLSVNWALPAFVTEVVDYVAALKAEIAGLKPENRKAFPIYRMEPDIVIVDFITWFAYEMVRVDEGLYLSKDEESAANDGNHFDFDLTKDEEGLVKKAVDQWNDKYL